MYGYSYMYDAPGIGALLGLIPAMSVPTIISIASYVLTSLALYTLAQRRGIHNPWLAWIPVANVWILGSLSDQYRYVARGENRSKRKSLVILAILSALVGFLMAVIGGFAVVQVIIDALEGYADYHLFELIMGPMMWLMGLCIPLLAINLAKTIIRYMALYDLYKSMDPNNHVVFLVLSILFSVTEPFFLFFNRNKDLGMPPRRDAPVHTATVDPWENQ